MGEHSSRPILLTLSLLAACSSGATRLEAGAHHLELSPDGTSVALLRGDQKLLVLGPDALELGMVRALDPELSYDPYWLEHEDPVFKPNPPEDLRWLIPTSRRLEGNTVHLELGGGVSADLAFEKGADDRFVLKVLPKSESLAIAWIRVRATISTDEGLYGLGEWPDAFEHRGKQRPMQMEPDLSLESADNEAHVPVPLLIGAKGWGIFVKSRRVGLFDVAHKASDKVEITYGTAESSSDGLEVHLFGAADPLDITRHYYAVTSLPMIPAPWALGPWIWRDESRDQAEVESDVETIRSLDLATSAIWIDRPYASHVNTFDFDPTRFQDPGAMIKKAHDFGLRMALWSTPYLEPGAEPMLTEATTNKYFPPVSGTRLNGWSDLLDLTKPQAFQFWQALIHRYTDLGIEGFKLDYAEDVIPGVAGGRNKWLFADGSDEHTMHYGYTLLYHQVYAETLPVSGGFLLCRAGRWGDQAHVSVIWPGDMDASLNRFGDHFVPRGDTDPINGVGGLAATMIEGVGLGPSGFPFFGADTGGYRHSPPNKETYVRWFEQTALSTVMQVGDSSSQPPWVMNAENGRDPWTLDRYREYARLHQRLFPYLWTFAQRLAMDGRAIQRPVGLAYPELGKHPDDEYLLGSELLVSPVMVAGATTKAVEFPPGGWVDWFTGVRVQGPASEEVPAPLEKLPLYLKAGGIVPLLRPTIDTVSPTTEPGRVDSYATDAGVLYVRTTPGPSSSFTLYDGTRFSTHLDSAPMRIDITAGSTFKKGEIFEIISIAKPSAVSVDQTPAPVASSTTALDGMSSGWAFTPGAGGTLWIKAPAGSTALSF
ncbi:MAG: glycoside hydrolase family 31 protein [Myxococcota bacterium]